MNLNSIFRHRRLYNRVMITIVLVALTIFALGYILNITAIGLKTLTKWFLPFILAFIISYFIEPLVTKLEKRVSRGLAVILTLTGIVITLAGFTTIGIYRLYYEASRIENISQYQQLAEEKLESLNYKIEKYTKMLPGPLKGLVSEKFGTGGINKNPAFEKSLKTFTKKLGIAISKVPIILLEWLVILMLSFLAAFFVSKDRVIQAIGNSLTTAMRAEISRFKFSVIPSALGFLRAQIILVIVMSIITFIGLAALNAQFAFILAMLNGLLSVIPVVGPIIIFVPWIIIVLAIGNYHFAIQLTVLFALLIAIREVLIIKVVSHQLGLSPLLTFMSIYVGVEIFGGIGVILGPFSLIIIKALFNLQLIKEVYTIFILPFLNKIFRADFNKEDKEEIQGN